MFEQGREDGRGNLEDGAELQALSEVKKRIPAAPADISNPGLSTDKGVGKEEKVFPILLSHPRSPTKGLSKLRLLSRSTSAGSLGDRRTSGV